MNSSQPYSETPAGPYPPPKRQDVLCGLERSYKIDYFLGYCCATLREWTCLTPRFAEDDAARPYREDVFTNRFRKNLPRNPHTESGGAPGMCMNNTPSTWGPMDSGATPEADPDGFSVEDFAMVNEELHARLWDIRMAAETLLDEAGKDGMDVASDDELSKTTVIWKLVYLPVRELHVHVRRIRTAVDWSPVSYPWRFLLSNEYSPSVFARSVIRLTKV